MRVLAIDDLFSFVNYVQCRFEASSGLYERTFIGILVERRSA